MKKFTLSLTAAAVLVTGAMAECPKVATDGTGDFLVAPAFFTTNGWDTKLKVVNTNLTNSIFLRVVIRDSACAKEVDFPILLSPSDVWTGTMTTNADGNPIIVSSDDSNYVSKILEENGGIVLNEQNPNGSFKAGYVEFYPLVQFDEGSDDIVSKDVLKERFFNIETVDSADVILNYNMSDVDNNSVTGIVTLVNNSVAMTLPMTAVEGTSEEPVYGNKMSASFNTQAEAYMGYDGNVEDLMNVLEKETVSIPFENQGTNSQVLFTAWNDISCPVRTYDYLVRDNEENREIRPTVITECEVSPCPAAATIPPKPVLSFSDVLGVVLPTDIIEAADKIDPYKSFLPTDGWIKMSDITRTNTGVNEKSLIATYMQILDTKGSPAFNWMYLPYEYSNPELYLNRECASCALAK
jgi:hypothetical protein